MIDLSTIVAKKAFVQPIAQKHLLDTVLVCAVCEQESGWNPLAVRPEPAFKLKYIDPMKLSPLQSWTRSMSWGLMQIMGQTAIEFGFTGAFLTELCLPEAGVEYGCRKLRRCLDLHNSDVLDALAAYNGGSNPDYGPAVQGRMAKYF
jgi:soluble lytic murein transglycosylase-like protein